MIRILNLALIVLFMIFLSGCPAKAQNSSSAKTTQSKKTTTTKTTTAAKKTADSAEDFSNEPTKYNDDSGLRMLSMQNNPEFSLAGDKKPQAPDAQALDSKIRPVLAKYFGGAKLVKEGGQETRQSDGEVILNTLHYKVKGVIQRYDADTLHAEFLANGFSTSPRLGSKPTDTDKFIMMSLFTHANMKSYSLVIRIDLGPQTLKVESYQLGSKYDRLM